MGFRPVSQRLRNINLQALGKSSCPTPAFGLGSVSHPASPVQAPSFSQDTANPSSATSLGLKGPAHVRAETWNVGLSGAISVRDELRWVF